MARVIELVATTDGEHTVWFGWDDAELASFSIMMYITHYQGRAIDWLQSLSLGFISFMGGDVWVHNDTDVPRANLFGDQKEVKVGIVANQDANVVKLLDAIGIHSDGKWDVESITIPKTLNTPNGMYSKLPKERFKKREGIWQAEFLRNMKSSGDTLSISEAIKGEPLRGYSAYLVLKNTDTTETKLFKVDLRMTTSR